MIEIPDLDDNLLYNQRLPHDQLPLDGNITGGMANLGLDGEYDVNGDADTTIETIEGFSGPPQFDKIPSSPLMAHHSGPKPTFSANVAPGEQIDLDVDVTPVELANTTISLDDNDSIPIDTTKVLETVPPTIEMPDFSDDYPQLFNFGAAPATFTFGGGVVEEENDRDFECITFPEQEQRQEYATDFKTPTEYTLHIIFTQFVRLAERKLSFCADHPLHEDAPVIETLSEGGDPAFDKIVSLLGFIAKNKPKPVIDLVMFWRKLKLEIAAMAAVELERIISSKALLPSPLNPGISKRGSTSRMSSPVNGNHSQNQSLGSRAKRLLSLMRTKSFPKFVNNNHRRNQSTSALLHQLLPNPNEVANIPSQVPGELDFYQQQIMDQHVTQARKQAIVAERKLLALIYILCRVLIEIVKQLTSMGPELRDKLEEIVYTQLKTTDPMATLQLLTRLANWTLFCELLGQMSEDHFVLVLDRFVADLEKYGPQGSPVTPQDEPRLHLLIHGMRFLKIRNYPPEDFEETLEFIRLLAKFFAELTNETVMFAYCEVIGNMLLPLAPYLTAEVNHPVWVEAMELLFNRAQRLWSLTVSAGEIGENNQNMTWLYGLHLLTGVLACLRKELFAAHWFNILQQNSFKLRAKVEVEDRITYVVCVARLMWVYLYRLPDTLNNTLKKLDAVMEMMFLAPTKKQGQWLTNDQFLVGALVELLRVAGYSHLNHMLENVMIPAMSQLFNGQLLEGLVPEKLIVLIRAYLVMLEDYENGQKPKFPLDEVLSQRLPQGPYGRPQQVHSPAHATPSPPMAKFNFAARTSANLALHDEIARIFANLLRILDTNYGAQLEAGGSPMEPQPLPTQKFYLHFGIDFLFQTTKELHIQLFVTLLEAVPWTFALGPELVPYKLVVDLLTRNVTHENRAVAMALMTALQKMALRQNALPVITHYVKCAFQFTEKPQPGYNSTLVSLSTFKRLLKLYVELLNCWVTLFEDSSSTKATKYHPLNQEDEQMLKDVLNDMYQVNFSIGDGPGPGGNGTAFENGNQHKPLPLDELEWKAIITVIEEVEGHGLFFVCLTDHKVRHYGFAILKLVELFDRAMAKVGNENDTSIGHLRSSLKFAADAGTRLIHILENLDFFELVKPLEEELSLPERARVTKLKVKPVKRTLIKIAESDYGLDATLWMRLFPKVMDICFEKCPMPVAICRLIVCVRLVQMHELITTFSQNADNGVRTFLGLFKGLVNGPPEVLVNQWKLFLIFACCLLTLTNEQKLLFAPDPVPAGHGRKRLVQMFIQHQTITSAKLVFRMVYPLLRLNQAMVRDAVWSGLLCLNINIFRPFLETLPECLSNWKVQGPRDPGENRVRIETVHILALIMARFVDEPQVFGDDWIVANLVGVVKQVKSFLSDGDLQQDWEFQWLRRYWCQFLRLVVVGLQHHREDIDNWIPFEARIGCFSWLTDWCGFGSNKEVELERYLVMYKKIGHHHHKEAALVAAKLEVERMALQLAALKAMAVLVALPIVQDIDVGQKVTMLFDIPKVMGWIRVLMVYHEGGDLNLQWLRVGEEAFSNIVKSSLKRSNQVSEEIIRELFASDLTRLTEVYFTGFVAEYITHDPAVFGPSLNHQVICLAAFLIGNPEMRVREAALDVLEHLNKPQENIQLLTFRELVMLLLKVVYKKALFDILSQLALILIQDTLQRILYVTKYFGLVLEYDRRDLLACLLPWILLVILQYEAVMTPEEPLAVKALTQGRLDLGSLMVLNNLFEITLIFSETISNEVEALWVALGLNRGNFDKILDFILLVCLERKHPQFVLALKQIVDYLAFNNTQNQQDFYYIVDKFLDQMHPRLMVPPQPKRFTTDVDDVLEFAYVADLGALIPYNDKDPLFSLGQLSLTFMVDLFTIGLPQFADKLALLVHVLLVLLDHYLPLIQNQALEMLIHLLRHADTEHNTIVDETTKMLRDGLLWAYDDLNNDDVKRSARTPVKMDRLVRNILKVIPTLQNEWLRVALHWATTCAVRHIACRSFQVFRLLLLFLDQLMLRDMLHRLSNTIADDTDDIQGFAMQIIMTLNAIVAELLLEKLIDFPQLFWLAVACLYTVHEQEFIELLLTMAKFVAKIDLAAPDTILCLILTFPPKWEGRFEGLQSVILAGTRLGTSWEPTIKLLDKLIALPDQEVIGIGDYRLLMALIPNLPRFLHALQTQLVLEDVGICAERLATLATVNNKPNLARILVLMAKYRFRSKDDFLQLALQTIRRDFFPQYEAPMLMILLGMLGNLIDWVRKETLKILRNILPTIDFEKPEFLGVGADLISPLLRLLLTEDAEDALKVLDEVEHISGSQFDREVLRMSLSNGSKREVVDRATTLFGVSEELGWSVANPVQAAGHTRNNVHAVYLTCAGPAVVADEDADEDDNTIEFHREIPELTPTNSHDIGTDADIALVAVTEEHDALLLNVWAALDDLDLFFTKEQPLEGLQILAPPSELVPAVYENDVLFILNRSLARTQSNISFRTGLADTPMVNSHAPLALPKHTQAYHSPAFATRRLYIPFRLKRVETTPKMDNSQFEMTGTPIGSSPYGNGASGSLSTIIGEGSGSLPDAQALNHHSPLHIHHLPQTRFETILGGNRKRLRKLLVLLPVQVVQLPENPTVATANILNQPTPIIGPVPPRKK